MVITDQVRWTSRDRPDFQLPSKASQAKSHTHGYEREGNRKAEHDEPTNRMS